MESRHEFFKRRLKELGVYEKECDYDGLLGRWVEELSSVFASQGHSGQSATLTIQLFTALMKEWEEGVNRMGEEIKSSRPDGRGRVELD